LFDGRYFKIDRKTGEQLREWLETGADAPPPVVDPEFLTADQIANITALCDEAETEPAAIVSAYKSRFGCESLEQIPSKQYSSIVRQLEEKRKSA
jgi:hypothetical protein